MHWRFSPQCLDSIRIVRELQNLFIISRKWPSSYILVALSEIFASITGLEYAFTKAPKNMRSLVMSIFLFMSALSSAVGEAFVCV